jgi:hypothetical protein
MILETPLVPSRSHLYPGFFWSVLLAIASASCGGRSHIGIGGPCTGDESCTTGVCLRETRQSQQLLWQGGYCSGNCESNICPTGTCLLLEDGNSYCLSICQKNEECRVGYVCATSVQACLPDCRLGWSCGSALTCNDKTGTCDPPPVTPAPIGAPCTWNVECTSGLCTPEQGTSGPTYWTGGACTQDCTSEACPSGSTCVTYESGGKFCSPTCAATSDCRSGYVCATAVQACLPDCRLGWSCGSALTCNAETGTCDSPPVTPAPIGAPCTWNVECASGLCTPEQGSSGPTYWTGGACTQDCTTTACPTGSKCASFESAGAFCIASCVTTSDCRTSYVCDTDVLGCFPDCRLGWPCGTYFICDGQTGMCVTPPITVSDGGADTRSSSDDARGGSGGPGGGGAGGRGPAF